MKHVLSRAQARAFDAHAIVSCKVPSLVLMENAGRGAADVIERELLGGAPDGKRVVVVAGVGNNGGDGFVVARHLRTRGAEVMVVRVGEPAKMTPDCLANALAFEGLGGKVRAGLSELEDALPKADVIVDALFGTGLDRPIVGELEPFLAAINASRERGRPVASLDVPSGLDADTGEVQGAGVWATLTVAFAHAKLGLLTARGAERAGELFVVDIGVPPSLAPSDAAMLVEPRDVRARLLPRPKTTHKYAAGHVAIFAGSRGKTGAAALCALGVLRGGAGAATMATWEDAAAALEGRVLEAMVMRLASEHEGSEALRQSLDAALSRKTAVVVGPGLGTGKSARRVVEHVLASFGGTIVADADCFSLVAGKPEAFAGARGAVVLTPHAGELGRLLGCSSEDIESNRFRYAAEAAAKTRAVVLLKGAYTIVAAPDGRIAIAREGSPVLATAGSGDVLSGLVGALSCSLDPFEAAWAGGFLHGAAGRRWQETRGDRGMRASEIAELVPEVLAHLASFRDVDA